MPGYDGRLEAEDVEKYVTEHYASETFEHMPQPGMVEIANATELGTVYTLRQLTELSRVCRKHKLPLYLDGARLGYALAAEDSDLTFEKVAELADVFTIGGTKQGALYGEALVIVDPALQKDFRYHIKQRGGLLSKGFLMGIQFEALMTDDLYLRLSRHADRLALRFRDALRAQGVPFWSIPPPISSFRYSRIQYWRRLVRITGLSSRKGQMTIMPLYVSAFRGGPKKKTSPGLLRTSRALRPDYPLASSGLKLISTSPVCASSAVWKAASCDVPSAASRPVMVTTSTLGVPHA